MKTLKLGLIAFACSALVTSFFVGPFIRVTPHAHLTQVPQRPIAIQQPTESTIWASTTTTAAPAAKASTTTAAKPVAARLVARGTTTTIAATDSDSVPLTPLAVAQSLVGTVPAYASKGFWCALAVDDYATQAHVPSWTFEDGPAELFNDALAADRIHPEPHVGDMVFIDLRDPASKAQSDIPDVQVMHVGVVEAVNGNAISTIEGNVGADNTIKRMSRNVNDGMVIAFGSFPG